ncbi:MAG: HepT-like ribonuclease domain-containing protein [Methylocystis sp.]
MRRDRNVLHLDRMLEAARLTTSYVEGMDEAEFLADSRTQQAVAMNLIIIGEAVIRIPQDDPDFLVRHPERPWRQMTGMRNRIAHGYFDVNMRVVWETSQAFVPQLLSRLPEIRAANSGDQKHS